MFNWIISDTLQYYAELYCLKKELFDHLTVYKQTTDV